MYRAHRLTPAVDQADYSIRQVEALHQAEGELHRQWHSFRWLQDETVSAGDGIRQIPERNHRRKVEWRNSGDDADGLANHGLVNAR